jgi:hypothetical protein
MAGFAGLIVIEVVWFVDAAAGSLLVEPRPHLMIMLGQGFELVDDPLEGLVSDAGMGQFLGGACPLGQHHPADDECNDERSDGRRDAPMSCSSSRAAGIGLWHLILLRRAGRLTPLWITTRTCARASRGSSPAT